METSLQKFKITDSDLAHEGWVFPSNIETKPYSKDDNFLTFHTIDKTYDRATVQFKLLVAKALRANLQDTTNLPFDQDVIETLKDQRWVSDEYVHLWQRDDGGSATLTSGNLLTFMLQTPRDSGSFCSLSLVNRDNHIVGGFFITDEHFSLQNLLASQPYLQQHQRVPRDFAVLPFQILLSHVKDTTISATKLSRDITSLEKRSAEGRILLDDNADYKLLNRLNLEHVRLERRSYFEEHLASNLLKYLQMYEIAWTKLWEKDTKYIKTMREKIGQQERYIEQTRKDLEMMPRRIDNQSKAWFNFIAQRDNRLNLQMAESSKKIAEESRMDNLLSVKLARATAQVAEETRKDSAAMKTIAILTLTFLPGTAVASFFSMNGMFNWMPPGNESIASPYLYIYFVVTVPLTVLIYGAWWFWFRRMQQAYKKNNEDIELEEYERMLMSRMRNATNSWRNVPK